MNDGTSREIDNAISAKESPAPNPMCNWYIDQQQPEYAEQQERRKTQTVSDGARDQCHRDDGESHLVNHEQTFGNRLGERRHGIKRDAVEENAIERTDERTL